MVWSPDGSVSTLPLPGRLGVAKLAAGEFIVGEATYPLPNGTATEKIAVWRNQELLALINYPNGGSGNMFDINVHGRYVGKYGGGAGAFAGQGSTFEVLEWPGFPVVEAVAINDSNAIVGTLTRDGGITYQSYIAHGQEIQELPQLAGFTTTAVLGINNAESIVGICWDALGNETAVVFLNGDRTPVDLNTLIDPIPGVRLIRGIDVNNAGQILVAGEGGAHYVLSPIPEPVFSAMLVGLVIVSKRRRR